MPGDLLTSNCIVAFLISSRVSGSSSPSFKSTWEILDREDSCAVRRSLKRPRNVLNSAGGWRPSLSAGYFHSKSVEGLGSDVRVHRRPQCFVEGAHVTHVSIPLCPLGKSCPPIILHGPELSLKCTACSLVCSLGAGSLIIRFLQADYCDRSISFRAALGFSYQLHQTSLGVFGSTGQQLQPWFPVVWSSSASTVPQALQMSHNEVFPPT